MSCLGIAGQAVGSRADGESSEEAFCCQCFFTSVRWSAFIVFIVLQFNDMMKGIHSLVAERRGNVNFYIVTMNACRLRIPYNLSNYLVYSYNALISMKTTEQLHFVFVSLRVQLTVNKTRFRVESTRKLAELQLLLSFIILISFVIRIQIKLCFLFRMSCPEPTIQ